MRKKAKTKKAEKALGKLKEAIKEGRVQIGNAAAAGATEGDNFRVNFFENRMYVEYSIPGFGFGSFCFGAKDIEDHPIEGAYGMGKLVMLDSEACGKETIKKMLCDMVDQAEWDWPYKRDLH